ncbi:2-phospho-L-lactate guanylyltransferase [Aeromicrobium sp. P5_D10]
MSTECPNATAIVPIKPWGLSKSRLNVGEASRPGFARAFALDVLDQVADSSRVGQLVIVTAEPELGAIARRLGAVLLTDRPMLSRDMLNVALDSGRRWAMSRRPEAPVIVVPGDLAALTAETLDDAIDKLSRHDVAFVPDMTGRGTTLAWAHEPSRLRPFYGRDSAARHAEDGAREVCEVDPRVRQDVDTSVDLREVRRLGLGPHTSAALTTLTPTLASH